MSKDRNPEEFAQYIEDLIQSPELPSANIVDDPLVEVALQLAHDKPPQLSAEMRARMLRKVQEANQNNVTETRPQQTLSFPVQHILRWVAVFAVVILLMNNVALPAMADSLPGDILYPAKLTIETIELSLASSDTSRTDVYIRQAQRRLDEAEQLLDRNIVNEQLFTKTLENLDSASQLSPTNPVIQAQITANLTAVNTLVERVADRDPLVANNLSQQLAELMPTPEPIEIAETSSKMPEPTLTPMITSSLTLTPTDTSTPKPSATDTSVPSNTPTLEPSATFTTVQTDTKTPVPSPTFTDEPTLTPTYESYVAVVSATSYVNIRRLPTTDGEILQQVAPGTIVNVIGKSIDAQWLKIEIKDGQQGWIASSLIVKGTVPEFTLSSTENVFDPTPQLTGINPSDTSSNTSDSVSDNSGSNQGNDGINKFGCDGQGNSCNTQSQGNGNGNNNGNSNGNKGGNKK